MLVLSFICVQYIPFYQASWLQVFEIFQLLLFWVKGVNQHECHVLFSGY